MLTPDLRDALAPLVAAFEALHIHFMVGESVASSWLGVPRSTLDVDVVADLNADLAMALYRVLSKSYYVDQGAVTEAIHSQSPFNLIHEDTMQKIDVFVLKQRSFDQHSFARRHEEALFETPGASRVPVASPEDIILNKLEWFRMGNEISERQWNDVLGVMKVQHAGLDWDYLRKWAADLGVLDLLERAEKERVGRNA